MMNIFIVILFLFIRLLPWIGAIFKVFRVPKETFWFVGCFLHEILLAKSDPMVSTLGQTLLLCLVLDLPLLWVGL